MYALGSYGKTLGVYLEPQGQMLCLLQGQVRIQISIFYDGSLGDHVLFQFSKAGGLTHVQFSSDGSRLLAGGRRDPEVLVWDMRNPGNLFENNS